jgi:hypothetical protein
MPGPTGAAAGAFLRGLAGEREEVPTRRGPVTARRGGIPGLLASIAGGTANAPILGPIASSDAPPIDEVSAIHEQFGHNEGRGALYDLKAKLKGEGTPSGLETGQDKYWSPSEVYAYTTQPAELSANDIPMYRVMIQQRPELLEYFLKHRNPESDWPDITPEGR